MKKKILAAISALFIILSMTSLTACQLIFPDLGNHEHSFGEWEFTTVPTCNHGGARIRHCECGESETETVPAQHNYNSSDVCKECGFEKGEFFKFESIYGGGYAVSANNITDNKVEEIPAEITIPSVYRGAPVTAIATDGFKNCKELEKVKIPSSITVIRDNAFSGCVKLTDINIGQNITYIGYGAFENCQSLVKIDLPDSITYIGQAAFSSCTSLASINIPKGITVLDRHLYLNCDSLTEVVIPDNITTIKESAFSGCDNLASVTIPDSVTNIGSDVFGGTKLYESLKPEEGVIYFGKYLLKADETVAKDYTVKEGTTVIAGGAFKGLHITNLTLPDSLVAIGLSAFSECENLVSVDFGEGVRYIHANAFKDTSVEKIYLPDSIEYIGSEAFNATGYSSYTQDIRLPDKVVEIHYDSFYTRSGQYDESGAFYVGKHLIHAPGINSNRNFVVKEGTITIANEAFRTATGGQVINVVLPDSLQYIGDYAFSGCKTLQSVNIPENVTYIGTRAFSGCSSLKSLIFEDPEGWQVSETESMADGIAIPAESLSDSAEAIKCIKITYSAYYWTKK